ncbi:MAG TPA: iron ABC transporter permease [Acidimicrobiales bacterium]|nr:iron ABC transporter permease [Acidimicrobiales bacterium]MDP6240060.1 iron ABC transporter permease [Acidimicrobiales bacterium]MDP6492217.1 iron ABC transporter permease [Acidimicrobiales bacterium]MDP6760824.1 iron ABC transporter permease [Acidimicrobiales bacterium]MDP7125021.1 iron ABC transporter permease [Acidimicrobiales bacterium]
MADDRNGARLRPAELRPWWVASGVLAVLVAGLAGLVLGPASLGTWDVLVELADRLPFVDTESGLGERQAAIVWEIRLPRVVLGLLVGAMLATAGGAYQGVFRNPLADPYLLGVAAGAGFGATVAIVSGLGDGVGIVDPIPMMAFAGALVAVVLTYLIGATGGRLDPVTSLVLAGVAVASFFTAIQTFVQQRHSETIRQVYFFVLGQLRTAGWDEVTLLAPYTGVCLVVILAVRRRMDTLGVGDEEAGALGLDVRRVRLVTVVAASLGTAAAVSVSGLIGFVGIIVPHTVRLLFGSSYRVILPLTVLFGGAFLVAADLVARLALEPAEMPIGVVTAFLGAPFFVLILRTARSRR